MLILARYLVFKLTVNAPEITNKSNITIGSMQPEAEAKTVHYIHIFFISLPF